jgi:hypothetical protein
MTGGGVEFPEAALPGARDTPLARLYVRREKALVHSGR